MKELHNTQKTVLFCLITVYLPLTFRIKNAPHQRPVLNTEGKSDIMQTRRIKRIYARQYLFKKNFEKSNSIRISLYKSEKPASPYIYWA